MVIIAKSETEESLLEHTENALKVFKSIKEAYPEIPQICGVPDFWEHLFYSIFFHDFGKAASGCQESMRGGVKWKYRHEVLSAGFVSGLEYENQSREAVALAIITHHKDVLYLREMYRTDSNPLAKKRYAEKLQELIPNFEELREIQQKIPEISKNYLGFELTNFKEISSIEEITDPYKNVVKPYKKQLDNDELTALHGMYGIFLKGFLTACDHLASGGKYSILNGIKDMRAVYNFSELRKTQSEALETKGDAFLIAPTGTGKTEAALFWTQANQNPSRSKRVFYLLPYTASINAMYKRLQEDFKDPELIGIQHSKAMYYLYRSFEDEEDYLIATKKARQLKSLTDKIYRPYKIATPHQILKSMFGIRGFEQNLAEMSNALIIMDEIHAYDAHMTALILETLKILKGYQANFLIMSATLPSFLKEMFKRELEITTEISFTEDELDKFTRHKVSVLNGNIFDNLDLIRKELADNKKVLVVCNTVARAQNVYRLLSEEVSNSRLIHGRFILRDREEIESKLKDLSLLVGTQAIEVSLDIDYDVLFSEPAPLDALIQRFGRVNRKGWENKVIKPVYIFEQGSEKDKYIYNQESVAKSLELLSKENILGESRIQTLVDEVYSNGYQGSDLVSFENVKKMFPKFYSRIVPFINEKEKEDEFYKLYRSVEVVPIQFKLEYLEEIENKRYFEAMKYVVSIRFDQYKKLQQNNQIQIDSDMVFASVDYSSKFGLLLDSNESIMGIFSDDS
ncbi:CRISPR-associated helicase, Cas3 family [Methanosarcina thermophila]|jgi:CRISPR-associated endonuclease/helicase Cas3|uniref:CRISPR-associated helicase, Cas3 family n=1 Tax=Methanosarcina thermophila TaxID=2210 RepID=A0A3G9CSR8_METTE|nr:CRISPR-associated helicase, Cas3 family [Methanosarcina thermophila]